MGQTAHMELKLKLELGLELELEHPQSVARDNQSKAIKAKRFSKLNFQNKAGHKDNESK